MTHRKKTHAFTLIEVIAILIIAATVAALSIHHLAKPGLISHQRSCDTSRELLQGYAQQYYEETGNYPTSDLKLLATPRYAGDQLPVCPISGKAYVIKNGVVHCEHGSHDK